MTSTVTLRPSTPNDVQDAVRTHQRVRPVAGRTKPALSILRDGDVLLDMSGLAGVTDYQPAECTFTAWAGTRLADIETMLANDGLYMPFDPPFSRRGATLGGTVAAGLSGPGRFRYGGVRDFLLGARIVDGDAHIVRGGGRVVKNAAGFYLQHLLLGSFGRLGVLLDLTFKVFPSPPARATLVVSCGTLDRGLDLLIRLRQSTFEIEALDLTPAGELWIRMGGLASALDARVEALTAFVTPLLSQPISRPTPAAGTAIAAGTTGDAGQIQRLDPADADAVWLSFKELDWASAGEASQANAGAIVKVSMSPSRIAPLEARLRSLKSDIQRRYSAGGEVAWLSWPVEIDIDALDGILRELALSGLVLTGAPHTAANARREPIIGVAPDPVFLGRVREALDPRAVFA